MKIWVSLFLSAYLFAGSLFPGNSFSSFSELPNLFQHFKFHTTTETPGISFFDFMAMHYGDDAHEKSDPNHHQKLPFHHQANSAPADKIAYTNNFDKFLAEEAGLMFTAAIYNNVFFPSTVIKGIFHPPKA